MKNFTYFRPTSPEQAVGLLEARWGNTELLAGGTDLLDLQKEYIAQPSRIVSLAGVAQLNNVSIGDRAITLGAGMTIAAVAAHASVRQHAAALAQAAAEVGAPQIRNMGTLGGNLCQRNRCWYFRDEHTNCLLKGGPRCNALDGENKYHAVFTAGHRCVIVHPSTLAPALIALGASADVQAPNGRRTVELAKFFRAPTGPAEREHTLAANELVLSVTIPIAGTRSASYEVRHKQAYDWPLVQAAVAFQGGQNGAKATGVRIVLGHVAPTPYIAEAAQRALDNRAITEASATAAGRAAAEGAKPLSQNGYKLRLIEVAVKRALLLASGAKPYWEV
ncbi:MAG: FAD binding domain-containing protein [Gemmataceae bacterium]|nr:FAD binding domain-containing protein [Gemmataceae bacterium]